MNLEIGCNDCNHCNFDGKIYTQYYCKKYHAILHKKCDGWYFRRNPTSKTYYPISNCKNFIFKEFKISDSKKEEADRTKLSNYLLLSLKIDGKLDAIKTIQDFLIIL